MPDLRGLSAREAVRSLTGIGLSVPRMSGTGFVIEQSPSRAPRLVRGEAALLKLDAPRRRPCRPPEAPTASDALRELLARRRAARAVQRTLGAGGARGRSRS